MKTIRTILITGLASLAVAAAPVAIAAPHQPTAVPHAVKDDTVKLTGIVKNVSENKLTLKESADDSKETEVQLPKETKYVKAGAPAKAGDVTAGVRVSIHAKQGTVGLHEAIEVTILPSTQAPKSGSAPIPEPQA